MLKCSIESEKRVAAGSAPGGRAGAWGSQDPAFAPPASGAAAPRPCGAVAGARPFALPGPDVLAGEAVIFAALYAATGVFAHLGSPALAVLLFGAAGARLVWRPAPGDWAFMLAAAILGPLGESAVSATG